ncbi:unnamed protein product [Cuscuta europaea]|uniref:Uncharacterized protein n=1 Tax=Cuscuta europaea TaxID=41803 RepID=A0A9P0ZMQ0_CUSEU|nr:unnamed protein product [Cuscuta europaea]
MVEASLVSTVAGTSNVRQKQFPVRRSSSPAKPGRFPQFSSKQTKIITGKIQPVGSVSAQHLPIILTGKHQEPCLRSKLSDQDPLSMPQSPSKQNLCIMITIPLFEVQIR